MSYMQFLLLSHRRFILLWTISLTLLICLTTSGLYLIYVPSGYAINVATLLAQLFIGAPYYPPITWFLLLCLLMLGPALILDKEHDSFARQLLIRFNSKRQWGVYQIFGIFALLTLEFLVIITILVVLAQILGSNHSLIIDNLNALTIQIHLLSGKPVHFGALVPFFAGCYITLLSFSLLAYLLNSFCKQHVGTIICTLSLFLFANVSKLPNPVLDLMIVRSIYGLNVGLDSIPQLSFLPFTLIISIICIAILFTSASREFTPSHKTSFNISAAVKWLLLFWKQIAFRLLCIILVCTLGLVNYSISAKQLMGIEYSSGDYFIYVLLGSNLENNTFIDGIEKLLEIPYIWILIISLFISSYMSFSDSFFDKQLLVRFKNRSSAFVHYGAYNLVILFIETLVMLLVSAIFCILYISQDAIPLMSNGSAYSVAFLSLTNMLLDQPMLLTMLSICYLHIILFALCLASFSLIFDRLQVFLIGLLCLLPSIFLNYTVLPANYMMLAKYIQSYLVGHDTYMHFLVISMVYILIYIMLFAIARYLYIYKPQLQKR